MSKSIKLKNDTYWDGKSVVIQGHKTLYQRMASQDTFVVEQSSNGSNYPQYFLLAKLPATSNSNGATLRINGFLGSYISNEKAIVDILIANRNGLNVVGTYIGFVTAFKNSYIAIYQESNGKHAIYYVRNASYTGGSVLNISGTNMDTMYVNSTTAVTPSGTLVKTIDSTVLKRIA